MLFAKSECTRSTVRTSSEESDAYSWESVLDCLNALFAFEEDFVVLTLADTRHNIRYVQSALTAQGLIVQLGIEEEHGIRLVEKICSAEECLEIFRRFFETSEVKNIDSYSEVKFK